MQKRFRAFEEDLLTQNIKAETKGKHLENIDILLHFCSVKRISNPEKAIKKISLFMNKWLHDEVHWWTNNQAKGMVTSLNKFYKYLYQNDYITDKVFKEYKQLVKEEKEDWTSGHDSHLYGSMNFERMIQEFEKKKVIVENNYFDIHREFIEGQYIDNAPENRLFKVLFKSDYYVLLLKRKENPGIAIFEGNEGLKTYFDLDYNHIDQSSDFKGYYVNLSQTMMPYIIKGSSNRLNRPKDDYLVSEIMDIILGALQVVVPEIDEFHMFEIDLEDMAIDSVMLPYQKIKHISEFEIKKSKKIKRQEVIFHCTPIDDDMILIVIFEDGLVSDQMIAEKKEYLLTMQQYLINNMKLNGFPKLIIMEDNKYNFVFNDIFDHYEIPVKYESRKEVEEFLDDMHDFMENNSVEDVFESFMSQDEMIRMLKHNGGYDQAIGINEQAGLLLLDENHYIRFYMRLYDEENERFDQLARGQSLPLDEPFIDYFLDHGIVVKQDGSYMMNPFAMKFYKDFLNHNTSPIQEHFRLMHNFMLAAVNLYGALSKKRFLMIIAELLEETPQHLEELDRLYISHAKREDYEFFWLNDVLYHEAFKDQEELGAFHLDPKKYYIPCSVDAFLDYADEEYIEDEFYNQELFYWIVKKSNKEIAYEIMVHIKLYQVIYDMQDILDVLDDYNIILSSEKDFETFTDLFMNAHNKKPNWYNHGFKPEEVTSIQTSLFNHMLPKPKKVGRNDPCPCGSGKKYKKCCLN